MKKIMDMDISKDETVHVQDFTVRETNHAPHPSLHSIEALQI